MSEKLRHGHDPQIMSECFVGAFNGHSTAWDGIKLAHNLSATHCLYLGPEPQSRLPSSVSLSPDHLLRRLPARGRPGLASEALHL